MATPPNKRLHIGASSLELLAKTPTAIFIDQTWTHLGDPPNYGARSDTATLQSGVRDVAKKLLRKSGYAEEGNPELYSRTNFRAWMFNSGDTLDFPDDSIDFIYSEHVFEHFRYDIAMELFRQAHRILKPGAVIRTVVPDSDYRTYEAPEPAGYPNVKLPMNHPNKHKVRWSKYLLMESLAAAGFSPVAISWCDDEGVENNRDPKSVYPDAGKDELVYRLDYVQRPKSLIIDGIKI